MPTGVRAARTSDVDQIAAIQVRAWEGLYGSILATCGMALDPRALAETWGEAILRPPHSSVRVLVATQGEEVVGFAAIGPSYDPDLADAFGEVHALMVGLDHLGHGHGSRLMAACIDHLRAFGYRWAATWTLLDDQPRRAFWQSAGWGPDSARRTLGGQTSESGDESGDEATLTEVRLVVEIYLDHESETETDTEGHPPDSTSTQNA